MTHSVLKWLKNIGLLANYTQYWEKMYFTYEGQ